MLLPLLAAAGPPDPADPPTPREPETEGTPKEIEPPAEPPTEPGREPPSAPDPEVVPPGVPFQEPEPEPDIPDGPGVSDPDLAQPAPAKGRGAPLGPPVHALERVPPRRALADDRMDDDDDDVPFDTASLPPDHPAYDRIQNRTPAATSRRSRVLTVLTAVALVAAGLLITYVLLRPEPAPTDAQDLLTLAAAHAGSIQLDVVTSDLDQAEEFIIGEFGWPIRVPVLPDTRLEGVGVEALTEGVEVPVLLYQTGDGEPIVVYAYDYAFLDAAAGRLQLADPVYARLADEPPVDVRRVGDAYLVLWRRRAAIYTAVMADDPAPLVEYLQRR